MSEKVIRLTPDMVVSMMRAHIRGCEWNEKIDDLTLIWRVETLFAKPCGWSRAFLKPCAERAFRLERMTPDANGWFCRSRRGAR